MNREWSRKQILIAGSIWASSFIDLAKTSFAAMVTGALLALFTKNVNVSDCVLSLVIGICSTLVFAGIAYYILKI